MNSKSYMAVEEGGTLMRPNKRSTVGREGIFHLREDRETSISAGAVINGTKKPSKTSSTLNSHIASAKQLPQEQGFDEDKTPTRTQLEPSGYYAGWNNGTDNETDNNSDTSVNATASLKRNDEVKKEISESDQAERSPIIREDYSPSVNMNARDKPPWSTSGLQFHFPRKRRSPGENHSRPSSTHASIRKPSLSSYNAQWTSILEECSSELNHSNIKEDNSSDDNTNNDTIKDDLKKIHKGSSIKNEIIKSHVQEYFLNVISTQSNQSIIIQNDNSVTGRYNTKKGYQPFGFVPSTEKACQREQYEVFQSPLSITYDYFENHVLVNDQQISSGGTVIKSSHRHYKYWDPKTMQYSSQPLHLLQPLSQLPLTVSCSATAASRAALLSAMTNACDDCSSSTYTNESSKNTLSLSSSSNIMGNITNDHRFTSNFIEDAKFRRDSGGQEYGRRHSLYMPSSIPNTTTSFDTTNNHQYINNNYHARESSRSAQNLRRTFMGILNPDHESVYNYREHDSSTTEAAEDLFHLSKSSDNPNLLQGFSTSWTSTSRSKSAPPTKRYLSEHKNYEQSNGALVTRSVAPKKRRKSITLAKAKPKKIYDMSSSVRRKDDMSSIRRSSRKRTKRSFEGDSSDNE